jgi:outer membrane protein TolC
VWGARVGPDLLIQSESSTAVDLIAVYKALGGGWEEDRQG